MSILINWQSKENVMCRIMNVKTSFQINVTFPFLLQYDLVFPTVETITPHIAYVFNVLNSRENKIKEMCFLLTKTSQLF